MATLVSSKTSAGVTAKSLNVGTILVTAVYTVTAALSAGDVVQMVKVPKGCTPVYVAAHVSSGSCAYTVGDGSDTDRFITTSTGSAAAALIHQNNGAALPYTYTADDTIDVAITGVTTGTATGEIKVIALFSMDA